MGNRKLLGNQRKYELSLLVLQLQIIFQRLPHIFDYARLRYASADIVRHPGLKMAATKTGSGNNS